MNEKQSAYARTIKTEADLVAALAALNHAMPGFAISLSGKNRALPGGDGENVAAVAHYVEDKQRGGLVAVICIKDLAGYRPTEFRLPGDFWNNTKPAEAILNRVNLQLGFDEMHAAEIVLSTMRDDVDEDTI